MKTIFSFRIGFILLLIAIIATGIVFLKRDNSFFRSVADVEPTLTQKPEFLPSKLDKINSAIIQRKVGQMVPSDTDAKVKSDTNPDVNTYRADAVKQPDGSMKVITDIRSGQFALVADNGRMLSLQESNGNTLSSNDIIAEIGPYVPLYFQGKIDSMSLLSR